MHKKETIIKTATELFVKNGFRITGINEIIKKSKVAKMTLYKYFKTKDELIIAVLENVHEKFVINFLNKIDNQELKPDEKIINLVKMLHETSVKAKNVRCIFINASAEFSDINNPICKIAYNHKLSSELFFKKQLGKLKISDASYLARIINTLTQGALVMAQIGDDKKYYKDIIKIIKHLIDFRISKLTI